MHLFPRDGHVNYQTCDQIIIIHSFTSRCILLEGRSCSYWSGLHVRTSLLAHAFHFDLLLQHFSLRNTYVHDWKQQTTLSRPSAMTNFNASHILDSDVCEIRLTVDANTTNYHVHHALLKSKARYFRAQHISYLTHTGSTVYHFVEPTKPVALRSFVTWLYTGKVYFGDEIFEPEKIEPDVMDLEPDESWGETNGKRDLEKYPDLEDVESDEAADLEAQEAIVESIDSDFPEPENDQSLEFAVWRVWKQMKPVDLDAYQVRAVMLMHLESGAASREVKHKLQTMFHEKRQVKTEQTIHFASEPPPLAYDRLIDLYILAHRYEAPELCDKIITLLQAEHDEQQAILGGRPLPSSEVVARAYGAVPKGSTLRDWLLNIYTCNWKPVSLSEETIAAMEELPKEFVTQLLLAHSQTTFGQTAEDWSVASHPTRRAR